MSAQVAPKGSRGGCLFRTPPAAHFLKGGLQDAEKDLTGAPQASGPAMHSEPPLGGQAIPIYNCLFNREDYGQATAVPTIAERWLLSYDDVQETGKKEGALTNERECLGKGSRTERCGS